MLTTIILIILISVLFIIAQHTYNDNLEVICGAFGIIFCIVFFLHIICLSTVNYGYEQLLVKRDSIEETLQYARKNNNPIELATISQDINKFNQELASSKYVNTTLLFDQYIDDRIMNIPPIR